LEKRTAHLTVQAADTVDSAAAPDREIRHVELFIGVIRILAPKRQHITHIDRHFLRVILQILFDQLRCKAIKASGHSGVGGKEVTGARCRERYFKGLTGLFHKSARAFKHG
jgi:hypothetical protein